MDRSANMRAIKSQDTRPEMIVRRLACALGYRYRLHPKDIPGKPDIVFPARRKVIFVNGCFWHAHDCRRGYRQPKNNSAYWGAKIDRNRKRDIRVKDALRDTGWDVLTVWECETKPALQAKLADKLLNFLGPTAYDGCAPRVTGGRKHDAPGLNGIETKTSSSYNEFCYP